MRDKDKWKYSEFLRHPHFKDRLFEFPKIMFQRKFEKTPLTYACLIPNGNLFIYRESAILWGHAIETSDGRDQEGTMEAIADFVRDAGYPNTKANSVKSALSRIRKKIYRALDRGQFDVLPDPLYMLVTWDEPRLWPDPDRLKASTSLDVSDSYIEWYKKVSHAREISKEFEEVINTPRRITQGIETSGDDEDAGDMEPTGEQHFSTYYETPEDDPEYQLTGKKEWKSWDKKASRTDEWGQTKWTRPKIELNTVEHDDLQQKDYWTLDEKHHNALAIWGRLLEMMDRGDVLTEKEKKVFEDAEKRLRSDTYRLAYIPTGEDETAYYKSKKAAGLFDTIPGDYRKNSPPKSSDPQELQNTHEGAIFTVMDFKIRMTEKVAHVKKWTWLNQKIKYPSILPESKFNGETYQYLRSKWRYTPMIPEALTFASTEDDEYFIEE